MKAKKTFSTIVEEIIANGIGWVAGLLSVDVLKLFFIEKKWTNAWGLFSKKTAVSGTTFSFLEWTLTAIIGFIVMFLVNQIVRKKLIKKREKKVLSEEKLIQETEKKELATSAFENVSAINTNALSEDNIQDKIE